MKLRSLPALLALAICLPASAQFAVYGKFDALRLNAATVGSAGQSVTWFTGPGGGIYYDFVHFGPLSLGVDLRGNILFAQQQKYRSGLLGIRLAANPPVLPIRPFIQGSVGAGGSRFNVAPIGGTSNYSYSTKFQYEVLAGLDYTLLPHFDVRLAEIGYGRMSGISSTANAPNATLFTISAGVVLRIH